MLITLSGVDCAGKSTQIELLRQYFISIGKSCTVFWYRPGYSNEMQNIKKVIRPLLDSTCYIKRGFDKWRGTEKAENGVVAADAAKSPDAPKKHTVPAPIWLSTAMIDTVVQWGLRLRYLCRRYDVVICDRYVEDARLDLMLKYPQYIWTDSTMQWLAKVLPRPDFSFLLWIPADEMIRRAEIKQEPFPDDVHTRQMRYRAYEFVAEQDNIILIDAACSVEETHREILEHLEKK